MTQTERLLALAIARGDRIAAVNLAQRLWHPGDIRRTAVVAQYLPSSAPDAPDAACAYEWPTPSALTRARMMSAR